VLLSLRGLDGASKSEPGLIRHRHAKLHEQSAGDSGKVGCRVRLHKRFGHAASGRESEVPVLLHSQEPRNPVSEVNVLVLLVLLPTPRLLIYPTAIAGPIDSF
jgi:hypothetical protein